MMKKNIENKKSIIIAIGDIHGSLGALKLLYEKICASYDPEMVKFVFLGDYCDRGESSKGVIDFLANLKKQHSHFVFLLGNHEYMILQDDAWGVEAGLSILFEYPENRISDEHMIFLKSLKPYYESQNFLFLHGGIPPGCSDIKDVPVLELLWWYGVEEPYLRGGKCMTVITGHLPSRRVTKNQYHICIDTGCCFSDYGKLTALVLDDDLGEIIETIEVENPRKNKV